MWYWGLYTCKHKEGSACCEIVNGFTVQYTLIFTNHIMEDVMQKLKYDTSCDSKATKVPKFLKWSTSTDINECELEAYPCSSNANCTDTEGSFNCTCREGFEGDGFNCTGKFYFCTQALCTCLITNSFVADIPECERGLDGCDPNATCTNTIGSYVCNCNTGFTGDGFTCPG